MTDHAELHYDYAERNCVELSSGFLSQYSMKILRGRCGHVGHWHSKQILAIAPRGPGNQCGGLQQCRPPRAADNAPTRFIRFLMVAAAGTALLSACTTFLPTIGPSRAQINRARAAEGAATIQFIDIDEAITRRLLAERRSRMFSETLGGVRIGSRTVGAGDLLEVSIWEATPATLFGSAPVSTSSTIAPSHSTTLPEQPIDDQGFIFV